MSDQDFLNTEMDEDRTREGDEMFPAEGDIQPEEEVQVPSSKPTIVVKKGEETILEYVVDDLPVLIGRKGDNHIVLEEKNISRKHAQILMKEDQYVIVDSGSAGGTKLNGEKITEKDIHTGDKIEIGDYTLHFDSGLPDDERTVFEVEEETVLEEGTVVDEDRTMFYEEPEAKLVVVKSDSLEGEIVLEEGDTVFGRDEEADITIADKRLSRKHCKIAREGNEFVISDLGSSNGTFVNGQKITEKTLASGDRIQAGSNVFEFRVVTAAVPGKRPRIGVLVKGALAVAALAVLAFVVYRFILTPGAGRPQKVIMQVMWEQGTTAAVSASPSLGDLNGDGFINLVAADRAGVVYALDGRQGGLIWNSEFRSGGGAILSSPLLVDINERDGDLDVIVGTTAMGILAIDGGTMRQIWTGRIGSAASSSPAAADINGDGIEDVFIGTVQGMVYCLDGRQGGAVWSYNTGARVESAPALADLNGDGISDVIIGSNNYRLYSLDGRNGRSIWTYSETEQLSTVACGDFNGDKILDVALVTPTRLVVLEGQSGAVLWTWAAPTGARPTHADPFLPVPPALADLNDDGTLDVVISTPGGHVYAVDGGSKGSKYLWDYGLTRTRKSQPALCDLNGDRTMDVIVGDRQGNLIVIDGKMGHQLNQLKVGGQIDSCPVIGDFTSDGIVDIAVGTQNRKIIAVQTETRIKKNRIVWGSFAGNTMNTGTIQE